MTTRTANLVPITGNTYPVKDELKAIGAKWDADQRVWVIHPGQLAEAAAIVAKGSSQPAERRPFVHNVCKVCGHKPRYGDRYDRIYKSGECRDCYEERKMGY